MRSQMMAIVLMAAVTAGCSDQAQPTAASADQHRGASGPSFSNHTPTPILAEPLTQRHVFTDNIAVQVRVKPDGTGVDATETILAELPATRIIFLTIHEDDQRIFEAIRHGAVGYLPKNVTSSRLLSYLRRLEKGEVAIQPEFTARILKEFANMPVRESAEEDISRLTPRQREILRELKTGATNRQIAARLVISEQTVKNHVSRVLKKLNLKSRHELG